MAEMNLLSSLFVSSTMLKELQLYNFTVTSSNSTSFPRKGILQIPMYPKCFWFSPNEREVFATLLRAQNTQRLLLF